MSRKISTCSNQWPAKCNKNCCLLPVTSIQHWFRNASVLFRFFTPPLLNDFSSGKLYFICICFCYGLMLHRQLVVVCIRLPKSDIAVSFSFLQTVGCPEILSVGLICLSKISKILTHLKGKHIEDDKHCVPLRCHCSHNHDVFHYCHSCSYTLLIISVLYAVPTPVSHSQKHIHRKVAEIPVFWVTGNRSEKLCIILFRKGVFSLLFSFLNDLAATNHKLSHPGEEKVCGVFKCSPSRADTISPISTKTWKN